MITKHRFHLSAYSSNDDADTPAHFFITLDADKAKYFLRRMALFKTIQEVDPLITRMIYKSEEGGYFYSTDGDDNPEISSEATSITNNEVYVDEDGIFWVSFHEDSSTELTTRRIERYMLENLSKGFDPMVKEAIPPLPASSISPMQFLNQAVAQLQHPDQAAFFEHFNEAQAQPQAEVENTNESGDEGGGTMTKSEFKRESHGEAGRLAVLFASEVMTEMDRQGITRKQLAKKMGVSKSAVYSHLDGEKPITMLTMGKFAAALGIYFSLGILKNGSKVLRRSDSASRSPRRRASR